MLFALAYSEPGIKPLHDKPTEGMLIEALIPGCPSLYVSYYNEFLCIIYATETVNL